MPESRVRQIKILISSTRADLAQYRKEASQIIQKIAQEKEKVVQLVEISMEMETQSGDRERAVAVSKRWVEEADWVVVIVGFYYGTISDEDGADGLSVTEWEYRHAIKNRKKVYVFMAGAPGTMDQYRCSPEEFEDLKNWRDEEIQTEEQREKIKNFRKELSLALTSMFANLGMFRKSLEITLKNAIDDLPPDIETLPKGTTYKPDIFLSYSHQDKEKARILANCLETQGWSVWWDTEIPVGKTFRDVMEQVIESSRCILVIWSKVSVKSEWVLDEAEEGKKSGNLVPVCIDDARIPMGFRQIQTANLTDWQGESTHPEFKRLVNSITQIVDAHFS